MSSPTDARGATLQDIERQIQELEKLSQDPETQERLRELKRTVEEMGVKRADGSAWARVQLARHPQRPYFLDYVELAFKDFSEMSGDRGFADDAAVICGMATFRERPVMLIGQQKGRTTKEKLKRNWGMSKPEGYRKALRIMRIASKFHRPILTFLDTPGAYPGIDAEARGQAEAIAHNLREMARLESPIIVTVIGEGGSGGALGIGVGDYVLIQENAIYSVISPESCAAIVWRDSGKAELAANALRLTAQDLLKLGIVDEIVPEPAGGAQNDYRVAADALMQAWERALSRLEKMTPEQLRKHRYEKFRKMGQFFDIKS